MKIWAGYGSEHSMNLVLIGKFKEAKDAENAEGIVSKIRDQASEDEAYVISHASPENQRFSDAMLALLRAHELHMFSPADLEQFASEHSLDREEALITIRTDEADVSAFVKFILRTNTQKNQRLRVNR
jgi:hypothetical protein